MARSIGHPAILIALCLSLLLAPLVAAIDRISVQGKNLVRPNGERFYLKGLAYQESAPTVSSEENDQSGGFPEPGTFVDPLSLPANCTRDVANFRDLGINAIRVYSVNVSAG